MADPAWKHDPEDHDFPAALDYLELILPRGEANRVVEELRQATTAIKKAKDILRASGLPLLGQDNVHVKSNIEKVQAGKKLSPVLLVRGRPLIVADGYHRICAIYALSEDLEVPCRLV
ncbi:hypothetical protein A6P39_027465 [Streptomyces sp. FXJ1.172]|uniref:hypothetical protein n=1 Tax=Streptomyces sp. FXJ1.172 TaxID=710705 RepID=UPI000B0C70F0|nr:hypothetical protein [Streptomyces sp. FXJ1.172]WEO97456.1 hypothetical protein A6P39_027465 [Streptomyces sp. FXJ1.172]